MGLVASLQRGRRANAAERHDAPTTFMTLARLQRGRRANAAERPVARRLPASDTAASTGPPRERGGEVVQSSGQMVSAEASTGPPRERGGEPVTPESLGDVAQASTGPPRERGGETTARPHPSRCSGCFNGAAARTRRRVPCWRRGRLFRPWLQRGRRANAAERQHASATCSSSAWLQRGRRANAAESTSRWSVPPGSPMLQRGRRANAAERCLRAKTPRRCASFNGAAARTRRRADDVTKAIEDFSALQRGRRANAAESMHAVDLVVVEGSASTGPPRERGGEECRGRHAGRHSDAASTGPPRERGGERARARARARRPTTCFNGAAARTRRRGK